ncbi:hypothetical protein AB6N24_09835 [Cellulomonas sp. 179-A 4D5 NHS]|uniref:hypothetical protein n=1 Tax=Cellulomonas sp. 179-A 4D5 NHS TaxID=3142378 RepID=UPI0039A3771F
MDVLSAEAHRTLAYIALVNRGGARPSRAGVAQFFRSAEPKVGGVFIEMVNMMARGTYRTGSDENPVDYLLRMEWIRVEEGAVVLTSVGQALVRGLDAAEQEEDVIEAVLDVDDPFAYAKAVTYLRTESPALLVDPYLRMAQLIDLDRVPTVERVLVGTKLNAGDLAALGSAAKVIANKRPLEVRKVSELHDRYLIPASGPVLMLGGSLGTIGRSPITLTTLSASLSDTVREVYEKKWADAEVVEPPTLPED